MSWLRQRRKKAERVEAEAASLIAANPVKQDDQRADVFAEWDRVLRTVAELTGKETRPDAATGREEKGGAEPDLVEKLRRYLESRGE